MLVTEAVKSIDSISQVAVCIQTSDRSTNQRHVGFFFRERKAIKLLHLKTHFQKEKIDAPSVKFAWVEPTLNSRQQKILCGLLQMIGDDPGQVSFGFSNSHGSFDRRNGTFLKSASGEGLTCATFVLGCLNALSFTLLDEENWQPRADDQAWCDHIINVIERNVGKVAGPTQEHIDALRTQPNPRRFRPEEVTGAFGSPISSWPVPDTVAIPVGAEIVAELKLLGL